MKEERRKREKLWGGRGGEERMRKGERKGNKEERKTRKE